MKLKIFCVIPAFNETGNLAELTNKLIKIFSKEKINYKILYVLQGDKKSVSLLKQLKKIYPQIHYVYYPKALGIGLAYKIGFQKVENQYTHILTLDADLNHQPEELTKFLKLYRKENPDIIIGSRFIPGGGFNDKRIWKKLISFLTNSLITSLLSVKVHDITSGYRLIRKEVIEKIKDKLREKGYPSYMELILCAHKLGFEIKEVAIIYSPRKWGKSKMKKIGTFIDY